MSQVVFIFLHGYTIPIRIYFHPIAQQNKQSSRFHSWAAKSLQPTQYTSSLQAQVHGHLALKCIHVQKLLLHHYQVFLNVLSTWNLNVLSKCIYQMCFPSAYIKWYDLVASVGGMDMCNVSLSISPPSFISIRNGSPYPHRKGGISFNSSENIRALIEIFLFFGFDLFFCFCFVFFVFFWVLCSSMFFLPFFFGFFLWRA